jgi:hypothetical protein
MSIESTIPAVRTRSADSHRFPTRLTVASEAFSRLIDYLMPNARSDYIDLSMAELAPLLDAMYESDDAADALVAALHRHGTRARAQFERALEHGLETIEDPLPEVRDLFAEVDRLPDWIDLAVVEEGARCLRRIDPITLISGGWVIGFLLAGILPNSARSLAANERTVDDPNKRGIETGRFVMDTLQRGGYHRYGAGCKTATRLRVMHAAIRHQLRRTGDWDESVLGAPISLSDTAAAALTHNVAFMLVARAAGYRFSRREQDAIAHFAACAMYRQGVPECFIGRTVAEQERILYVGLRTARGLVEPEATRKVMAPMVAFDNPLLPGAARPLGRKLIHAYARVMFGDALCDATGIPDTRFKHTLPVSRRVVAALETLRACVPGCDAAVARGADILWDDLVPRVFKLDTDDATHFANVARQDIAS